MGVFGYADDLSLLCPSFTGMKEMLKSCEKYARKYDILFNATKSQLLYFGKDSNNDNVQPVLSMDNGKKISYVTIINLYGIRRKTSKSSPDAIQINDKLSTDKTEMADSFNTYFSTICATSEIDNPNNVPSHEVYLNNPTEAEFNFEHIDNVTVLHYINKLKPSHSCGHDNISSNVLKIIAMEVSPCLTLIINQVLSTGQFLKNLKTAKVIPIHKTGEKLLMKNYRPISILPVVSKIIENVMHTQLTDYFTLNKLFTSQQYGYRENRSTELAALELMDRNLDNMNRNLTPVNVYIDLSKAFDCLDHNILLSKLKFYVLNDNAIRLLKNDPIEINMCNFETQSLNFMGSHVEYIKVRSWTLFYLILLLMILMQLQKNLI